MLEAAEERWLKDGIVAHCANVKSILGPLVLNLIPKPDLLVTTGYLCETSSKTLDLLHECYNIPIQIVDTCQDRDVENFQMESERIIELAAKSLKKLAERIHVITGVQITDDQLWEALAAKEQLNAALGKIKQLVLNCDPLLLSPTHENIFMCLTTLTLSMDGYSEALEALSILFEELQRRAEIGDGIVPKGAPRILAILPAGQTDPRLEHLVCELGLSMVAQDTIFRIPYQKSSKDPYEAIIIGNVEASMFSPIAKRIPLIIDGCREDRIEGILDRYHVGCRTVAGDALIIKDAVTKELGIPVLVLEWENFDPRSYDHNEFKRKLEVFKAMIMANRSHR